MVLLSIPFNKLPYTKEGMKKPGGIVNLIKCPFCEFNSYNEGQVKNHISLTHQEMFINHSSDYWGVVPGGAGGTMDRPDFNPISINGGRLCPPKKKAFQCDECTKAFSSISGLNYHKNIVHEEMRKNEDTGTHGFSDLPTALEGEDDNTKEVHKFFVINENGTEVFSCSKCGQNFSGFDGQHIKNCWNNESDNGKKTEEYPCESKTFDKRIGKIEKRNTELKATEANQVVTDFEEIEEETQSKTFVKRSGQGVEKCNSEFKASEANQEPYVVTDFEESEEETDEESN